jgi:hypothetical protein
MKQILGWRPNGIFFRQAKSACDGIGGTLKRLARLASLQRHSNNHIASPKQLFNWARENVDLKTFYVSSHSVQNNMATIERRMEQAFVVQGTRPLFIAMFHLISQSSKLLLFLK